MRRENMVACKLSIPCLEVLRGPLIFDYRIYPAADFVHLLITRSSYSSTICKHLLRLKNRKANAADNSPCPTTPGIMDIKRQAITILT